MNVEIDAYRQWLGIPAEICRPNHYELLGLRPGEASAERIQTAADQRTRRLQPRLSGERGMLARRILAEIAAARDCLLDPQAKADYDRRLSGTPGPPVGQQALPPSPAPPDHRIDVDDTRAARGAETNPRTADASPAAPVRRPPPPAQLPRGSRPTPRTRHLTSDEGAMPDPVHADLLPLAAETEAPRVPMTARMDLDAILEELVQAMRQCQQLYLAPVPPSQGRVKTASREFAQNQDRLHRGLLAKIYATITEADGRWTIEEQHCAAALLLHFGVQITPDNVQPMARRLSQQASSLKWQHVLQPFHQVPELRSRAAELQAIVMRIANLIAKADGFVAPAETAALQTIQQSIQLPPGPASSAAETRDVAAESQAVAENAVWASGEEPETPKPAEANRAQVREQRRQQVDALVGLDTVKQEIHELADRVLFHSRRRLAKLPHDKTALQFVFTGPAGTGKTLVARLLSELLYGCGGLRHGHLVEVSGFDIASRDVEGATNETKAYLRKSVGGTLLINDADALLLAENASATAARRVLRQNVAAHADRLAVVLASKRPDRLLPLLDQHPGVASLFPDRWEFPDYSTSQLGQIFQACCERSQYRVTRLAQIKVLLSFHWNLGHDRKRFGNGHGVERAFERAVSQLARRIAGISPLTKELLTTFHDNDIQIEGVPAKALAQLDNPRLAFAITCPGCGSIHLAGRDLLGIRVECKSCRHRFVSAWGEPVD